MNKSVDFLFVGDELDGLTQSDNIIIKKVGLSDFNSLASDKLNLDINIKKAYKICDFRPAFGEIFAEYTEGYDFWGYCDCDIVLGNIRNFITDDILDNFDYISAKPEYPSGFFSLFKNSQTMNRLYRTSDYFEAIFQSDENCMFDECAGLYEDVILGRNILDIEHNLDSLHHLLVRNEEEINPLFEFFSIEGLPGDVRYNNGVLSYKGEYEVLLYHLSDYKKNILTEKKYLNPSKTFFISKYKIYTGSFNPAVLGNLKDNWAVMKFNLSSKIDRILTKLSPDQPIKIENGTYSYMHQCIDIDKDKFRLHTINGSIYKSVLFKDYYYLDSINSYLSKNEFGIDLIEKNGHVTFFQKR
ncbi:hypothetical protein HNP36_002593 [Chryseobacterium shigense]|uniref:Uncharacterized protein n=2 Tax=Chryseobacterium shigense TaxID=297244 RepID=A0A841N4W1_9FLAO|nr:hypothetical protein [Chryseobacterium shigense]